jgi:fructose-bisphosphate aldolase class II
MPIITTTDMFKKAYADGYAVGAFNVNNMEIVQGITEAAKEENAPLILQVSAGARKYAKHAYLIKLVEAARRTRGFRSRCIWTTARTSTSANPVSTAAFPR